MALRVVLDTSVVVAGLRSRLGGANAMLRLVAQKRIIALATPPLFLEYEEVLRRPEHRLAHGLEPDQIDLLLQELSALIEPVDLHFRLRPQLSDPNDENGDRGSDQWKSPCLVAYNVADFFHAGQRFRIPALTPKQLLRKGKK
jgi:putative PIN family toxin of toxin-antitoxin system